MMARYRAGMPELKDGTLSLPGSHDHAPQGEQPAARMLTTLYQSLRRFLTSHPLLASSSFESVSQLQHSRAAFKQESFVFSLVRRRHGPPYRSAIVMDRGLHALGAPGSFAREKIW